MSKTHDVYVTLNGMHPEYVAPEGVDECPECEEEMCREDAPESWFEAICLDCAVHVVAELAERYAKKLCALGVDPDGAE